MTDDDGGWRLRESRHLFRSHWFNLRQDELTLPTGEDITYTVVEHPGYAMVVPLRDDGAVLLERVYRWTVKDWVLECPSGGLDGDDPVTCAHRELLEETGYRAGRLEPLGSFYGSNGISDERFHLFLATELTDTGAHSREPTEQMEIEWHPLARAVEMAAAGAVADAPSAFALLLAQRHLDAAGRAVGPGDG